MNSKYNSEITIDGKTIGRNHPTYFIADIAANHDGDLVKAKELIHLCKEAGADAAKFQHFNADTIVSKTKFEQLDKKNQSHQYSSSHTFLVQYQQDLCRSLHLVS